MQDNIHPTDYRWVVFHDVAVNVRWLMKSTVKTDKTIHWKDGQEYPLYAVETSMYSHPLYTGTQRIIDVEGRVVTFNKKYRKSEQADEKAIRTTRKEMS